MKLIPIESAFEYYCSEEGRIYKKLPSGDFKEMLGYKHQSYTAGRGYEDKYYKRFRLKMKSGKWLNFYGQRLVALTYHRLKPNEIVRHLTTDTMNNHKDAIIPGTQMENQNIDRLEQGTYWNRGGG